MLRGRALLGCTRGRVGRGLPGRGRCGSWPIPLPLACRSSSGPLVGGGGPGSAAPFLPCAWLVWDSCRARAAVRRCCRSCGWSRVRALGGYPHVVQGRCGGHRGFRAPGPCAPPGPPSQCGWRAAAAHPAPVPGSGGSRRRGIGWAQWGFLPSVPGWPPSAAGRRGRISTPLTTPWCAASGAAPTARGSRGRGLVGAAPDTMAVRGSGG